MKKLIIFDLDGTLYKTDTVLLKAIEKAFNDMHLSSPDNNNILKLIGEKSEHFFNKLLNGYKNINKQKIIEKISYYEKELLKEHGELYLNTISTLIKLKENDYQLAICSNGSKEYVEKILNSHHIKELFSVIKHKEINKSKSDQVKEIAIKLNVELVIVVGDSYHDIQAAVDNNFISVAANYGYQLGSEVNANFGINEISELFPLVCKLEIAYNIEVRLLKLPQNQSKVIGINGVDTSGKTTFARFLVKFLTNKNYKVQSIGIDEFHNASKTRNSGNNPIDSYIDNAFNLDLLKEEILQPLKNKQVVKKQLKLLDLDSDLYTNLKDIDIDMNTIVIIEGVLLYREPIEEYFDIKIYIDISFNEVLKRAEIRDVPKYGVKFLAKYKNKYIPIQKKYLKTHKPKHKSDFIIENNNFNEPKLIKYKANNENTKR